MKLDFYRPHERSATWFTGEVVNPQTGEVTRPPSMTKQSFKDECDINNILKQYKVTGMFAHINSKAAQGVYADLPDPLDFQASLEVVRAANDAFASLPSKVRDRFQNNPEAFLAFCTNPANADELVELGLATRPPTSPGDTQPVPAPVPAPSPGDGGTGG